MKNHKVYFFWLFLLPKWYLEYKIDTKVVESGTKWFEVVDLLSVTDHFWEQVIVVMFMGEYNHTIDAKGRLIIPSKFRDSLGDEFVVTKGLDGCLFVYDNKEWSAFEEKLKSLPLTNKDARQFVRFFLAGATLAEVDKQGRILVPANLREFAALEKEVVLVGVASRVEIWSKARWEDAASYDDVEEIAEHMAELGLGI